jgi:hypothetical protein
MPLLKEEYLHDVRDPALRPLDPERAEVELSEFVRRRLRADAGAVEVTFGLERAQVVGNRNVVLPTDGLEPSGGVRAED